jgi:hypothetical protein
MPFTVADLVSPGKTPIMINNYITNINYFPDYVFILCGKWSTNNFGTSGGLCGVGGCKVIEKDGSIPWIYKFCTGSVYAVKKEDFNQSLMNKDEETFFNFLNSPKSKEVIKNIDNYKEVLFVSPIKEEKREYSINLNQLKETPDKTTIIKNFLIYVYIIVPIVAILIIVLILIKRKRK